MLVHGEANNMFRLKSALQSRYSEREENIKIYTPKNCETVKLHFRGEKMAKVRDHFLDHHLFFFYSRGMYLDYWYIGSQVSY